MAGILREASRTAGYAGGGPLAAADATIDDARDELAAAGYIRRKKPAAPVDLRVIYAGLEGTCRFLEPRPSPGAPKLTVVLASHYLHPAITVSNVPVLLVRPYGSSVRIGPFFTNEKGVCFDCLRYWLRLQAWPLAGAAVAAWTRPRNGAQAWDIAAGVLKSVVDRYGATGRLDDLLSTIWEFDTGTLSARRIPVLPRRDCPRCGQASRSMRETLDALANPVTGLVEDLHIAPNGAPGLAFALGRARCRLPRDTGLEPMAPLSASGYGKTVQEARDRLVLEAVERHCAVYTGAGPLVAQPFTGGSSRLVESRGLLLGHPDAAADTTGCAAGFTYPQAIRHALLEVIERDAFARWWQARQLRPSLAAPPEWGLPQVSLFDLTGPEGIPVVAACWTGPLYLGAAADTCLRRAAQRAAREAAQFAFWGPRQGDGTHRRRWLAEATLETQPWLRATRPVPLPQERPRRSDEEETVALLEALGTKAEGAFWVDLTSPALGIPVVRVVVPELGCLPEGPAPAYPIPL